jgi:hypothetical protein
LRCKTGIVCGCGTHLVIRQFGVVVANLIFLIGLIAFELYALIALQVKLNRSLTKGELILAVAVFAIGISSFVYCVSPLLLARVRVARDKERVDFPLSKRGSV